MTLETSYKTNQFHVLTSLTIVRLWTGCTASVKRMKFNFTQSKTQKNLGARSRCYQETNTRTKARSSELPQTEICHLHPLLSPTNVKPKNV